MSVCAQRTESPGSFTSCREALGEPCVCGAKVEAELLEEVDACPTSTA